MSYQAKTIKEMLGGLYDLVAFHGSDTNFTPEQVEQIKRLYYQVDPHFKIEKILEEAKAHAGR